MNTVTVISTFRVGKQQRIVLWQVADPEGNLYFLTLNNHLVKMPVEEQTDRRLVLETFSWLFQEFLNRA